LIQTDKHQNYFKAKGEVVTFDGFLKIYMEGTDDEVDEDNTILPKVVTGDRVLLNQMIATERFSRPPFRFSEASLVKKM
jgi:DNA topoisomerase-1